MELAKPLPSLIFLYQAFDGTIISIASFWGSDLPTFMYLSCSEMGSTYVYQAIQKVKGLGCYKQRQEKQGEGCLSEAEMHQEM